ncbi:MAG: patatin-like phospholipase family protein [Pseudomonadota bacterium]
MIRPAFNRRLLPLLALALVGACGSAAREPVAEARIERAAPYGIPGVVRTWGDSNDAADVAALKTDLLARAELMHADAIASGAPLTETALALSGGGAAGAFGAGLLAGWSERGDRPEFDIVTGVSTGAIIALFAFLGPDYDAQLREFYTQYSTADLLEPTPFSAFTGGVALSDTAAYQALIDLYVDQAILDSLAAEGGRGRVLLVGTTNLDASRPVMWNLTAIAASGHPQALQLIRDVIRASSAIPAVFPPVVIPVQDADGRLYDEMHVDGGATQQVMLFSPELPVAQIDAAFGRSVDRTLYVVMNNTLDKPYAPVDLGVLDIAGKAVSSLIGGSGSGDLYQIYTIAQRDAVDFNVVWIPKSFDVVANEPFDPVYMRALYRLGQDVGRDGGGWFDRPPNFAPAKGG